MSASTVAGPTPGSFSLLEFAAATLFLSVASIVAPVKKDTQGVAPGEEEGTTVVPTSVLPPLADAVEHLLKKRQLLILHRYRRRSSWAPAIDHSLHFFDAHTLQPVLGMQKAWRLPESITRQSDSCYLPHGLGRDKPALIVATSTSCAASDTFGWAPSIFVLDENFNFIKPHPCLDFNDAPDAACSVCPHSTKPSVVLCASESMDCVMCLDIATGEWYLFGGASTFTAVDAIVALPSCGLLAVGSYSEARIAVCDLHMTSDYEDVDCSRFEDAQSDMCSTGFAPLGDRYFVCLVSWGLGIYDALSREQIGFFWLRHEGRCGIGGFKALEVPAHQQSTTLGLFLISHSDLLQIVRCDHQLQWNVVRDGGPLLETLTEDDSYVEFFAII